MIGKVFGGSVRAKRARLNSIDIIAGVLVCQVRLHGKGRRESVSHRCVALWDNCL